jgi:hypothetical protein
MFKIGNIGIHYYKKRFIVTADNRFLVSVKHPISFV